MIARRTLLILLNNALGAFLGFFALRYLARFPPEAYGAYVWALSALGVLTLLSTFGFREAHIKRVSEGLDEARANGTFFLIKLVLTTTFAVVVLGGYLLWSRLLGRGFTDATTEPVFVVVTGMFILLSFRQFFDTTFQAHQHTARAESVLFVDTVFSVGGVFFAWNVWARSRGQWTPANGFFDSMIQLYQIQGPLSEHAGALLIAGAYVVGRGASLLYAASLFLFHRYPLGRFSWEIFHSYKYLGIPLAFVAGLTVFYANVDRLFLGYFWDETAVANFQIPYSILTPMLFVATAVATLLFPTISQLDARGDYQQIRTQIRRAERYMTMILIPQMALALVFAREGINLFNARYVDEALVLRILVFFVFFSVLVAPSRSLLLGTGNPRFLLWLGIINVIVVVGLNLLLVPPQMLGLREEGAAAVAVIAALVGYVYTKHRAIRWTGTHYVPEGLWQQAAAGILLGLTWFGAREVAGTAYFGRLWQLVIVLALSAPLYLGFLILVGGFRRKDWQFIVDLLHPGKLAGYVGDELANRPKP